MPLAAVVKISSACAKALVMVRLPKILRNLSFEMTIRVSTFFFNSASPSSACCERRLPSKVKGIVTIATVSISISLAALAMTGAAPVPVPPPMPAVTKSILVLSAKKDLTSSIDSRQHSRPTLGFEPAPLPSVRLMPS